MEFTREVCELALSLDLAYPCAHHPYLWPDEPPAGAFEAVVRAWLDHQRARREANASNPRGSQNEDPADDDAARPHVR